MCMIGNHSASHPKHKILLVQWPSEAMCRADHKHTPLSTPQVHINLKLKKFVSSLFEDIRINKTSWKSQSITHKLKWSCFHCRLWVLLFLLVPPFSSLFFVCVLSLHMHIWTRYVLSNFHPCWFLVSVIPNLPHDFLIVYSFQGIKQKN